MTTDNQDCVRALIEVPERTRASGAEEQAESRRQTVHAVDEIDDVRDRDQPRDGQRKTPEAEIEVSRRAEGIGEFINGNAERAKKDAGRAGSGRGISPSPSASSTICGLSVRR